MWLSKSRNNTGMWVHKSHGSLSLKPSDTCGLAINGYWNFHLLCRALHIKQMKGKIFISVSICRMTRKKFNFIWSWSYQYDNLFFQHCIGVITQYTVILTKKKNLKKESWVLYFYQITSFHINYWMKTHNFKQDLLIPQFIINGTANKQQNGEGATFLNW